MAASSSDPVEVLSDRLSELYAGLEDLKKEGSPESLLEVLTLLCGLRTSMGLFERPAVAVLRRHDVAWPEIAARLGGTREEVVQRFQSAEGKFGIAEQLLAALLATGGSRTYPTLVKGNVYTRNDLCELFGIRDATIKNGVFNFKERHEIWLFVTENKEADREQYLDKLAGDTLYWQGQRMGRTDSLIIDHRRGDSNLLLFYRTAKYEFAGAAFRYEGIFEYVRHSGVHPTDFVLRRALTEHELRTLLPRDSGRDFKGPAIRARVRKSPHLMRSGHIHVSAASTVRWRSASGPGTRGGHCPPRVPRSQSPARPAPDRPDRPDSVGILTCRWSTTT
jgi:hypothetical protein